MAQKYVTGATSLCGKAPTSFLIVVQWPKKSPRRPMLASSDAPEMLPVPAVVLKSPGQTGHPKRQTRFSSIPFNEA
jgi:hypothetical protein